jgi:hypothetical protein
MYTRPLFVRVVGTVAAVILSLWSTVVCLTGGTSHADLHACCKGKKYSAKMSVSHQCCAENAPNYYASAPSVATPAAVVPVVVTLSAFQSAIPTDNVVAFDAVVV